eukprot:1046917-Rhodomonas_salina.1
MSESSLVRPPATRPGRFPVLVGRKPKHDRKALQESSTGTGRLSGGPANGMFSDLCHHSGLYQNGLNANDMMASSSLSSVIALSGVAECRSVVERQRVAVSIIAQCHCHSRQAL